MYGKVAEFVKYNNAFTFVVIAIFFGCGISFAANPGMRESIYSSEETLVSADNGTILRTDLDAFDFNLKIDAVTEDEKNYYAAYSYRTLAVENGVWHEREVRKTLEANKEALNGNDFGLYAARELGENLKYELSYLKRVKKSEEERGESKKVVTVEYSGLIGKFLDPKEMVIEGYDPVVPEPVTPPPPAPEQSPTPEIAAPEAPPASPIVPEPVTPSAAPDPAPQ